MGGHRLVSKTSGLGLHDRPLLPLYIGGECQDDAAHSKSSESGAAGRASFSWDGSMRKFLAVVLVESRPDRQRRLAGQSPPAIQFNPAACTATPCGKTRILKPKQFSMGHKSLPASLIGRTIVTLNVRYRTQNR